MIATETCITSDFVDDYILPSNYTSIRDDKCATKHGVFIAHKTNLIVSQVDLIDKKTSEFVLARLQVVGHPDLYIGSFYRHTNSDPSSLKTLHDNIEKLTKGKKFPNLIVAGDFNLPDINWPQHSIAPNPQYGEELNELGLNVMNDLYLTQMVEEPTRGKNILDLLFSSSLDLIQNVEVSPGISDHCSVSLYRCPTQGKGDQETCVEDINVQQSQCHRATEGDRFIPGDLQNNSTIQRYQRELELHSWAYEDHT